METIASTLGKLTLFNGKGTGIISELGRIFLQSFTKEFNALMSGSIKNNFPEKPYNDNALVILLFLPDAISTTFPDLGKLQEENTLVHADSFAIYLITKTNKTATITAMK